MTLKDEKKKEKNIISFSEACHIAVRGNFLNKVKWDISEIK